MGNASFPVAMVGIDLPGGSGFDLLAETRRLHPETEPVVLPGAAMLDSALSCLEAGALTVSVGVSAFPDDGSALRIAG